MAHKVGALLGWRVSNLQKRRNDCVLRMGLRSSYPKDFTNQCRGLSGGSSRPFWPWGISSSQACIGALERGQEHGNREGLGRRKVVVSATGETSREFDDVVEMASPSRKSNERFGLFLLRIVKKSPQERVPSSVCLFMPLELRSHLQQGSTSKPRNNFLLCSRRPRISSPKRPTSTKIAPIADTLSLSQAFHSLNAIQPSQNVVHQTH
jgi:hypothetical protein